MDSVSPVKRCSKCRAEKPLDEFTKRSAAEDGKHPYCRDCLRAYNRELYAKRPEHFQEYDRARREKNREVYVERDRARRAADPVKFQERERKRRAANRELFRVRDRNRWVKRRDRQKEYKRLHADEINLTNRKWRERNAERVQRNLRRFRENNKDKVRAWDKTKHARRRGAPGKISAAEWGALKQKYDFTCLCCGLQEPEIRLTLDHVMPIVRGGTHTIDNAQPLCARCNGRKHDKHIDYRPNWASGKS